MLRSGLEVLLQICFNDNGLLLEDEFDPFSIVHYARESCVKALEYGPNNFDILTWKVIFAIDKDVELAIFNFVRSSEYLLALIAKSGTKIHKGLFGFLGNLSTGGTTWNGRMGDGLAQRIGHLVQLDGCCIVDILLSVGVYVVILTCDNPGQQNQLISDLFWKS